MNQFLKTCRSVLNNKVPKIVVIGNESCDLDSAVCSISVAFHLSKFPSFTKSFECCHIIPVLNVARCDLPLRTEVIYFLQENRIDLHDLVCNDEIDLPEVVSPRTKYVLVDHHQSKYRLNVIGVIDHRPFDYCSLLNDNVFKYIELVGSCATLVTRMFQESKALDENKTDYLPLLNLLYGAIILDTVNFCKKADKARQLDKQMAEFIEHHLNMSDIARRRRVLFDTLVCKRCDISHLDTLQILSKDLKIVSRNGYTVAIPGLPILITGSNAVVLMGIQINSNNVDVRRDLGIINVNALDLFQKILNELSSNNNFCLENMDLDLLDGTFYNLRNVGISRKQILPLICSVLDNM
ncbi:exopolyphosphatase PRUNE1 isoform X2 [Topomyia yanbarensis]|uniref:exopolyphosphatase PRUNE1 isoform X2 n=1 Tax=Topomyia yanbarensis TaxID=2498891 RepID=UPI00273B933E|nr:exopolyphosphatase PRUNE1 isoform X2 [Topomyia yanbarensis]